jgi:hypothetical protein
MAIRLPRDNSAIIAATRDQWLTRVLSPRDRPRGPTERAVRLLFETVGLPRPTIDWTVSPVTGARAVHRFLHRDGEDWDLSRVGYWPGPEPRIGELRVALAEIFESGLSPVARNKVGAILRWPLRRLLVPLHEWLQREVARRLDGPMPTGPSVQMPAWPAQWHHAFFSGGTFFDVVEIAAHDCARRLGVPYGDLSPVLDAFIELGSCGYWWPYRDLTVLSSGPTTVRLDEQGRLHAADGPAIAFGPALRLYAWHGTMVPRRVVDGRLLDVHRILHERNAELRRMMIERYGLARFRREAGAECLHQDHWGTLWRVPVPGAEPVVTVEVVDSTPAPDGARRRYELRVPPDARTALEAVAWTFGLGPAEYAERLMRQT